MESGQVGYKIKMEEDIPRICEGPMVLYLADEFTAWQAEN